MGRREKALRVDLSSNWDAINEWRDFGWPPPYKRAPINSGRAPFKLNHMTTGCVSTVKWNTQCNLPRSDPDLARIATVNWSALEAAMIVWKYILLFTCLGIGVALCVGAISILRSPPDNGPPAWFAAVFGAMFFWGAFALARWRHQ
jgi:hypothetical protein